MSFFTKISVIQLRNDNLSLQKDLKLLNEEHANCLKEIKSLRFQIKKLKKQKNNLLKQKHEYSSNANATLTKKKFSYLNGAQLFSKK